MSSSVVNSSYIFCVLTLSSSGRFVPHLSVWYPGADQVNTCPQSSAKAGLQSSGCWQTQSLTSWTEEKASPLRLPPMGLKHLSCVPLSFCLYPFKQRLRKPPWQKGVSSREHFSKDCCAVCNVILSPGPHTLFLKTRLITSVVKSYWTRKQTTLVVCH